jgi:ADP-heptose:LPS heptosyltransferase
VRSRRINYDDLKIAEEILPLLRIRFRILRKALSHRARTDPKNALVVSACIIGDFLSYLPALLAFTTRHNITYDIIVSPAVKPLAERLKGVNRVFVAKSSYNRADEQDEQQPQIIPKDYDLTIVLRSSRDAYRLIKGVECDNLISSDIVFLKYIIGLTASSLLGRKSKQSREVMFEMLRIREAYESAELYDLFAFRDSDYDFLEGLEELKGPDKKILVHTGSGWNVKLWELGKWIDLFSRITALGGFKVILVGATEQEEAVFEQVRSNPQFQIHSLIGKVNLRELFLVMKRSDYFIGVDSGPRNLAHFANLRSVSLLSPAAVKNFMPFGKDDLVVEKSNRFPANLFNFDSRACLDRISVDEVFAAFKKLAGVGR